MKLLVFLIAFCTAFSGYADEESNDHWTTIDGQFSVQISLSKTMLPIDQNLTIQLILTYPLTYSPNINLIRQELLNSGAWNEPPFILTEEKVTPAHNIQNKMEKKIIFTLSPQLLGTYYLTFPKILFKSKEGKDKPPKLIIGNVFKIHITSSTTHFEESILAAPLMPLTQELPVIINDENRKKFIANSKLIAHAASQNILVINNTNFPWAQILSFLGVLLAIVLVKTFPPFVQPKPKPIDQVTAKDKAIKKLNALINKKLLEKKMKDAYFSGLDLIARHYVEDIFHINAPSLTTPEFLHAMTSSSLIDKETRLKLIQLLENSDRVKFSQYQPTHEESVTALHIVEELITR